MNTSFPGFSSPAASTEVPLEMLAACHIRIERQCATLTRLARHLQQNGEDEQARSAASNIIRYFDTSAIDHHADEEQDLFPALLESMAGSDAICIRDLIQRLTNEHRQLEARWKQLRQILVKIVERDSTADERTPHEPTMLDISQVQAFVDLYAQHLKLEEDELLPMADRLLSNSALANIGLAMRIRRGILDK